MQRCASSPPDTHFHSWTETALETASDRALPEPWPPPPASRLSPWPYALFVAKIALASVVSVVASTRHYPVTAANAFIVAVLVIGSVGGLGLGLAAAGAMSTIYIVFVRFPVYAFGLTALDDLAPAYVWT